MTRKEIALLIFLNLLILSVLTVFFDAREKKEKTNTLYNFAQGLAPSVWNFFEETPAIFLKDYMDRENHLSVSIEFSDGTDFIDLRNDKIPDRFLLPSHYISQPISFMDREIATIETTYKTEVHIPFFISLSILILIDLIIVLFRKIQRRNSYLVKTLEELNSSQQALVNSETKLAVNNLIIGLSHEINTPLGTILTSSSYLHEKFHQNDLKREDLKKGFDLISKSVKKMQVIMSRIKLIQINDEIIRKSEFDLKEISLTMFYEISQKNKCPCKTLEWKGPSSLPLFSSLDVWRKILKELLDNACQYGPEKGNLIIQAEENEEILVVRFLSEGSSIKEELLPYVFNPFHSLHSTEVLHAGIGLHLVNNLVEKVLKGKFYMEQNKDPVIFTIEVPKSS